MKAKYVCIAAAICFGFAFTQVAYAQEKVALSVEESVKLAMQNNEKIKQAYEDWQETNMLVSKARRSKGLSLDWVINSNKIGGKAYESARNAHEMDSSYPAYEYEYEHQLTLSMPIYTGGEIEASVQGAEYGSKAKEYIWLRRKQEVASQVVQAYYTFIEATEMENVRENTVKLLKAHYNDVEVRYEEGLYPKFDVLKTNVKLNNAIQDHVSAQKDKTQAENKLKYLVGIASDVNIVASESLYFKEYDKALDECIAYALEHRPDIKAAEYAIRKCEQDISVKAANGRPKLSAVMVADKTSENLFGQDEHSNNWRAGLQMKWNIFDNGINRADIDASKTALESAKSAKRDAEQGAVIEVRNAYESMMAAKKNVNVSQKSIELAERAYEIARVRYDEGVDTNLNVMDSSDDLTQARMNYYKTLLDYDVALAKLNEAMGA